MSFQFSPIIDTMLDLYQQPRSIKRFKEYLKILQGDSKDDMLVPIGNFNPMGKEHVLEKLVELKKLKAEQLIADILSEINKRSSPIKEIKVSLVLADDLKGAWTNRYTTDFDSKFKLNALITRGFCTPLFWTSEEYSEELIKKRTLEYCLRTLYWLNASKPITLKEYMDQEVFVAEKSSSKELNNNCDFETLNNFYDQNKETDRYEIIFNFFYGDKACGELNFPVFGIKEEFAGFEFAKELAKRKK